MSIDFSKLPHEGIRQLHPYVPGKSSQALKSERDVDDIIKLASNENPLGCSQNVVDALQDVKPHTLATYSTSTQNPLRTSIAKKNALDTESVCLSNGSDFLFHMLMECFALHTGKHILTHDYAFITYEVQANTLGIPIKKTPLNQDWSVDIDTLIEATNDKTALIFIANPNNPTGILIPPKDILRLLDNIPESTILVLDEAYHEYTPKDMQSDAKAWTEKYPNLVITRTFSKVYGLAALRLGYALANPEIISLLYRIQLPFVVNHLAMTLGTIALEDQHFVEESLRVNQEGMQQVDEALKQLELNTLPSACNFITFHCNHDGVELDKHLQARGIIIRPLTPYGLKQHLRVTIGTFEQNQRFLKALPLCLKETEA